MNLFPLFQRLIFGLSLPDSFRYSYCDLNTREINFLFDYYDREDREFSHVPDDDWFYGSIVSECVKESGKVKI